jgi:hypothetical protein
VAQGVEWTSLSSNPSATLKKKNNNEKVRVATMLVFNTFISNALTFKSAILERITLFLFVGILERIKSKHQDV